MITSVSLGLRPGIGSLIPFRERDMKIVEISEVDLIYLNILKDAMAELAGKEQDVTYHFARANANCLELITQKAKIKTPWLNRVFGI